MAILKLNAQANHTYMSQQNMFSHWYYLFSLLSLSEWILIREGTRCLTCVLCWFYKSKSDGKIDVGNSSKVHFCCKPLINWNRLLYWKYIDEKWTSFIILGAIFSLSLITENSMNSLFNSSIWSCPQLTSSIPFPLTLSPRHACIKLHQQLPAWLHNLFQLWILN